MGKFSQPSTITSVNLWSFFKQYKSAMCFLCFERCSPAQGVCDNCLINLPALNACCEKCREPLPSNSINEGTLCKRCQTSTRPFQSCVSPLRYHFPVSTMLQRVKYNRRLLYLRPLTVHMVNSLQEHYCDKPWPEALIPVPLHWWKMRKRGFNQAGVIASKLSVHTQIPVLHRHVKRVSHGTSQQGLSAKQRQNNMKGVFSMNKEIPYRHVAIVDDVMTTGATVEELCNVLKKHGVRTIDIWCLARTPRVS